MNDNEITKICILITLVGLIAFLIFYTEEFKKKTINELLNSEINTKGIVFGKIEYVIKNYPTTTFILNDGNKATIYYPKQTNLEKNDFVEAYVEKEERENLYAYKVINEK